MLNRRNGQIINLNKALGMLNEEERKKAISSASPGQIKDKLESATYTIAGQGKGERIKRIGTETRVELEKLLDAKVFIELWVKVRSGWADDEARVRSFGYE